MNKIFLYKIFFSVTSSAKRIEMLINFKQWIYKFVLILNVVVCSSLEAQTFEVEQIEQLFRPRVRVDSKYIVDASFKDTTGVYNQKEISSVFTFPIKTKFSADVKLDLSSLNLKDILKNSVRIKASQTLGVFRLNARQINIGFDTLPQKILLMPQGV